MFQANAFQVNAFQIGDVPGAAGNAFGWTTHFYKKRNKRKTKKADVEEFFNMLETKAIDEAPAPIVAQAKVAETASRNYLALGSTEDATKLRAALAEINAFYALIRAENKRQRELEDDEDEDLMLLDGF